MYFPFLFNNLNKNAVGFRVMGLWGCGVVGSEGHSGLESKRLDDDLDSKLRGLPMKILRWQTISSKLAVAMSCEGHLFPCDSVINPNFVVHFTLRANPIEGGYGMRSSDDVKKDGQVERAEAEDPSNV